MSETSSHKVLFFIESGGPGGAERVVLSLAEEYAKRNVPVLVATLRKGWFSDQLIRRGIEHVQLPSSGKSLDFGLIRALRALAEERKVTVVHSHLLDSNFYASLALRGTAIKLVATEHGDVHHTSKKRFAKLKMILADRMGARFTAVSQYTADHLRRHGVRRGSISVIGNPIQLPRLNFSSERQITRSKLGISEESDNHWVWVHVANFRKVKDQETLLRGFALALRNSPQKQTLVMVGDGPEKERLLGLSSHLGIQGDIRWVGFSDEVGVYLAAADAFVLSSQSEALPMSLLEAALYELVLLGTKVGGIPEVVQNGSTGFLFAPGSAEGLASAFALVLQDREKAKELGKKARVQVLEKFTVDRVIEQFFGLYSR